MGTVLVEPAAVERSRHVKRAAQAAGVGFVSVAGSLLATWLLLDSSACRNAPDYGCLGFALEWSYVLPFLNFLLTWALLRLLGLRPAWLTALLGTGIGWYLVRNIDAFQWLPGGTQYVQPVLCVGAFALAAWFTQSRRPLWPRAAVALSLVLLMPFDSFATTQHVRSELDNELADAGVPLLGPQLPAGYRLNGVGTTGATAEQQATFYYRISPDSTSDAGTMDDLHQEIQVIVGHVQPGFTPPSHCAALTGDYPVPSHACTPVAPGVWRWSKYDYVDYFTRVGDTVAVLQARTPPTSDAVLRDLAGTMRVRASSYFTGG
ncbi:hypothetical protein [Streptomyces sp. NPDC086182]|jgi:hypothetical protein|uniref:hypothetical protein n=1 Tax=Streptomyces sp. NPDC086182 TaxID=3155058 RepID=UPI00341FE020